MGQVHTVTIEHIKTAFETCSKTDAKHSEIASKWLQNGFLCVGVALDSAESRHISMKSDPIDTRTLQNGSQTVPK